MKIGVPKEIKVHEYRVGLVPAGVRELVDAGHQVLVQSGAGAGIGFEDSHYRSAGATIAQRAAGSLRGRGSGRQGQGAAARRVQACCAADRPVHLSAPGRRPRAGAGAARLRRHRHRLRNRDRARRIAAAADADERSRRPHVGAGGRQLPAEGQRRLRRAAGRRARRRPRQGRGAGRRRLRHACGRDGRRPARRRDRGRPLGQAPARAVVDLRQSAQDRVFDRACDRRAGARRGSRHRRRAHRRRRGAEARDPRHGQDHEAGRGAGRHRHRSGRLLRDQPARPRMPSRPTFSTASFTTA